MNPEFKEVVDFHRHLCLDIAVGYRVGKALMREMKDEIKNMKEVIALVGNETCALDAIQEVTGCTFGKRNLHLTHLGKPVYILQNTKTGKAVRLYCSYWESFDHTELRKRKKEAKGPEATAEQKAAFQKLTEKQIDVIMAAPESDLFSIRHITLPAPPVMGKYKAEPCASCGEYVNVALLSNQGEKQHCTECSQATGEALPK